MADSAPVSPNEERDVRATRRVWWGLAAVFVMLLGIGAWFYLFYDLPPPDPATYHYDFKPVPPGENALEVFGRETETLRQAMKEDWNKRLSEDDHLSKLEPGCEESLRAHVEAHQELLEQFQLLMREAPRPLAFPGIDQNYNPLTNGMSLEVLLEPISLTRRLILHDFLVGDSAKAAEQARELAAFAKEISRLDGSLMHWLMVNAAQKIAFEALQKVLPKLELKPEEALKWCQQLVILELESADLANSIKVELVFQANTWTALRTTKSRLKVGPDMVPTWIDSMTLKPNMSFQASLELILPLVRAIEKGWVKTQDAVAVFEKSYQKISDFADVNNWRNQMRPNRYGWKLLSMNQSLGMVVVRAQYHVSYSRCLQTALALRAFELEKGRLPERLEELVPAYLPAVPEDPVTGKALQWNPHTARLYSVGGDARDDGGDFDPEKPRSGDKDWGLVYPWSVKAGAKGSPP